MIGVDIISIRRIEDLLEKYGERFLEEIFSPKERGRLGQKNPEEIAGLFAAKEAISKARGEGIFKMGPKNILIAHDEWGKPYGFYKDESYFISISHDGGFATAIAMGTPSSGPSIPEEMISLYPYPALEDHKGSRGRVAILGGRVGMIGAAVLSAHSALRSGCGYVYIPCGGAVLPYLSPHCVEVILQEVTDLEDERAFLTTTDAIGMGPAMGLDREAKNRLLHALPLKKPMVIDADGLRILAEDLEMLKMRREETILTPHLGEMEALLGGREVSPSNREEIALEFAREHKITLLLKGPGTLVTDGERLYINSSGNPGMATAGSGDVLTGIISSFLAQGLSAFEAAKLGAYIHGLAGDVAAQKKGQLGLIATDIISSLSDVHCYFEGSRNALN